jgi:hypothetical protein
VVAAEDSFANVDLEIGARTRAGLAPLIEQFKDELYEMFVGRIGGLYRAHYESHGPASIGSRNRPAPNATRVIHELADAIEGLSAAGRRAWNAAAMRDFNVGVNIARGVWMTEHMVEPDAVRRVAALRGRLVFTAYQEAAIRKPAARRKRSTR